MSDDEDLPFNSIADFTFLALLGQVQRPSQGVEVDQRPGVSGTGFTLVGRTGEPFTLRSRVDQIDIQTAQQTVADAVELCEADVVDLVQDGYYFATENVKVKVLKVTLVKLCALAAATETGLNPPSGAWLELDWDLLMVDTDDEEDEEDD